jgi:signal transduction histidine kinase
MNRLTKPSFRTSGASDGSTVPSRRGSIGAHLVALLAVQSLLIAIMIAAVGVHDFSSARAHAAQTASSTATLAADALQKAVTDSVGALAVEAATPGYAEIYRHPESCSLTSTTDQFLGSDLQILRPDGTVACTSLRTQGGFPGAGYGNEPWFGRIASATKTFTEGPLTDPVTHQRALLMIAPIPQGGSLILSAKLDPTGRGLDERFGGQIPKPSFLVTTADGSTLITHSGSVTVPTLAGTPFTTPIAHAGEVRRDLDGVERLYAEATVPGLGWRVFTGVSTADAFADARKSLRDRIALGLAMILIVLAAGATLHRRFVRPIRTLANATQRASEGDLDVRITPSGPEEIAHLAQGFNFMLGMRAKAERTLTSAYETERDASDRLRELDTMKNSFLMAISHELRTPLTAVAGYAQLLDADIGKIPLEQAKEYTQRIGIASKRLEHLMLDLLDFERMTRGVVHANLQTTELRSLVDRVMQELDVDRPVTIEIPPGTKANVDAPLLERVIENLVVNANKHTRPGTPIWIKARRKRQEIEICIEDAGRGVPKHLRKSIFEPFVQGDVPSHSPGTGVGLALVAQFAKLHGGRAWVTQRPGGGASFRVTVPADGVSPHTDAQLLISA